MRYSEKILERHGISVTTVDLSEILGTAAKLGDADKRLLAKVDEIRAYAPTGAVPAPKLLQMARLGVVLDDFVAAHHLDATAIQCWTALEEFYGVVPCTLMSMMSESLLPSACETDVAGLVGMYVLQAASGTPAALLDWNNNYGDDPDKGVVFHCSNLPKAFFDAHPAGWSRAARGGSANGAGRTGPRDARHRRRRRPIACQGGEDDAASVRPIDRAHQSR